MPLGQTQGEDIKTNEVLLVQSVILAFCLCVKAGLSWAKKERRETAWSETQR